MRAGGGGGGGGGSISSTSSTITTSGTRSLTWTVYGPILYAGGPVRWNEDTQFRMQAFNVDAGAVGRGLPDAGGNAQQNSPLAGRYLYSSTAQKTGRFG